MAIVNPKNPATVQPIPPLRINKPEYKATIVDTRYIPSTDLITYMEGSIWTVDYYSQVLDVDSQLLGQSTSLNPVFQQYQLISSFELKVTTPLSTSQDVDSNSMIVTGVANVYPVLIPNVGDMFIADIGDGRSGVFRVTVSERKSIFKDTCHVIDYQLIDYLTDERRIDLDTKVIKQVRFIRDFLANGQNPLLVESEYVLQTDLKALLRKICNRYFKVFASNEFKTLIAPSQEARCYDPFLTASLLTILDTFDAEEIRHVKKLNCDGDEYMKAVSVWSALINKDKEMLKYAFKKASLVSAGRFDVNGMAESICHSGIQYVVYPIDPEITIDYDLLGISQKIAAEYHITDRFAPVHTVGTIYDVSNVNVNDSYVFSEAFYNNAQTGQSKLEICVWDYLEDRALDNTVLFSIASNFSTWTPVQQFYYLPVLMILLKYSLRFI